MAQAGANVFAVPAAFTRQTGKAHWETLLRARAIENGAFVIAPGQGGHHEDGRDTYGHSMIIGPWGEHIASMDHDAPGVLVADIDLAMAAAARMHSPAFGVGQPGLAGFLPVQAISASCGHSWQAAAMADASTQPARASGQRH